jgi:transcription antitermination factor NusG
MSEWIIAGTVASAPAFNLVPPLPASAPSWFAIYTRSNFEKRVAAELTASHLEYYLPQIQELHQWTDRKKLVEVPLFPGYVFARFADCSRSRSEILRIAGTVRILGHGGLIEPVPDSEIDGIRRLLRANVPYLIHPFLREGALVRVKRGPLKDLEGSLVRVKNKTRLLLSLTLLSQSVSTEIDVDDVEVIKSDFQFRLRGC